LDLDLFHIAARGTRWSNVHGAPMAGQGSYRVGVQEAEASIGVKSPQAATAGEEQERGKDKGGEAFS